MTNSTDNQTGLIFCCHFTEILDILSDQILKLIYIFGVKQKLLKVNYRTFVGLSFFFDSVPGSSQTITKPCHGDLPAWLFSRCCITLSRLSRMHQGVWPVLVLWAVGLSRFVEEGRREEPLHLQGSAGVFCWCSSGHLNGLQESGMYHYLVCDKRIMECL